MKKLIDLNKSKSDVSIKATAGKRTGKEIAVIGIGLRVGRHTSVETFWDDLLLGVDFVSTLPEERKADVFHYLRHKGRDPEKSVFREIAYLPEIDKFDFSYFKISPKEASLISPRQRIFLETLVSCLDNAGYGGDALRGSNTGIFAGNSSTDDYLEYIKESETDDLNLLLSATTTSFTASRLSYFMDFKGPAILFDTACSSSLTAIHQAVESLRRCECEYALAGGVKISALPLGFEGPLEIASSDNRTHPFDDYADGTGGGEGSIAFLLKPLKNALADNDHIYGIIKGSATNQDGASIGITAPNAVAQAAAIDMAWKDAKINPESIGYIEAHGTGTKLGDPIEINGLTKAFSKYTNKTQFCGLGTIKSNIGHLDDAAGAAGFLKALLTLSNKTYPPLVHFRRPNREIDFQHSPLFPAVDKREWVKNSDEPRLAGVSSFGMSGTNVHIVLEEAPERMLTNRSAEVSKAFYPVTLSAMHLSSLNTLTGQLLQYLYRFPQLPIADIAYTLGAGRGHYAHRAVFIADSTGSLMHSLEEFLAESKPSENPFFSEKEIHISDNNLDNIGSIARQWAESPTAENAALLAMVYKNGKLLPFKQMYVSETFHRIPLPGYDFARKRCWTDLSPAKAQSLQNAGISFESKEDGIFLTNRLPGTDDTFLYALQLSFQNYWLLREHTINGRGIFVATAYLQLAAEAALKAYGNNSFSLPYLYLNEILEIANDDEKTVLFEMRKDAGSWKASVKQPGTGKPRGHYVEMSIEEITSGSLAPLPVHELTAAAVLTFDARRDNLKDFATNIQVSADGPWNCLQKIYHGKDYSVAALEVNDTYQDFHNYFCYPPMLDVALNFALTDKGYLPYRYGGIQFYQKTPEKLFSIAKRNQDPAPGFASFTITLTDEEGTPVAFIEDYVLIKSGSILTGDYFHKIEWVPHKAAKVFSSNILKEIVFINMTGKDAVHLNLPAQSMHLSFTNKPSETERLEKLIKDGKSTFVIIYNAGDYYDFDSGEKLEDALRDFYAAMQIFANPSAHPLQVALYSINTTSVSSALTLSPVTAAASAFLLTLTQENSMVEAFAVESNEPFSEDVLLEEIAFPGKIFHRLRRDGTRYLHQLSPVKYNSEPLLPIPFHKEGAYLITGGTGGVALEIALQITSFSPLHIVLLTNDPFPGKAEWDDILKSEPESNIAQKVKMLRNIESRTSGVHIIHVDVTDKKELYNEIRILEKNIGNIRGIVHCAGLPGGGLLRDKKFEDVLSTLQPKILGSINLNNYFNERQLDFFLLCSSATALTAGAGQADYTAANSFLDAYAVQHNTTLKSVLWAAWEKTGMTANIDLDRTNDPVRPLSPEEGQTAFTNLLRLMHRNILVGRLMIHEFRSMNQHLFFSDYNDTADTYENELEKPRLQSVRIDGLEQPGKAHRIAANIWGSVLGYEVLSPTDNFYEIGGDSISAMRITALTEKEAGVKVTVTDLLGNLTINEFAALLENRMSGTSPDKKDVSSAIPDLPHYPAMPQQVYNYTLEKISSGLISYHIVEVYTWETDFDRKRFTNALNRVIANHEALRTAFLEDSGTLRQRIEPELTMEIPVTKIADDRIEDELQKFIKPFNLTEPPLFRCTLFILSNEKVLIAFDFHHTVFDGYSLDIFFDALLKAYNGEEIQKPALQMKEAAYRSVMQYSDADRLADEAYWNDKLSLRKKPLHLPADFDRAKITGYRAGTASLLFDKSLSNSISQFSKQKSLSVFSLLEASLALYLYKVTGETIFSGGISHIGRESNDVLETIGMFAKNFPLFVELDENEEITAFLKRVKYSIVEATAHSGFSFEKYLLENHTGKEEGFDPLYSFIFSYMNFESDPIKDHKHLAAYNSADVPLDTEYDFYLYGYGSNGKIQLTLKYKAELYAKETAERLLRGMRDIVIKIINEPDKKVFNVLK